MREQRTNQQTTKHEFPGLTKGNAANCRSRPEDADSRLSARTAETHNRKKGVRNLRSDETATLDYSSVQRQREEAQPNT
mgnify:CR=1 FL=1